MRHNRLEPIKVEKDEWTKKFDELCYEVFYKNPLGQELLCMIEARYFYNTPVAVPGNDPSYAFFREGYNDCIRSFRNGYNDFMEPST